MNRRGFLGLATALCAFFGMKKAEPAEPKALEEVYLELSDASGNWLIRYELRNKNRVWLESGGADSLHIERPVTRHWEGGKTFFSVNGPDTVTIDGRRYLLLGVCFKR